MQPGFHLFRCRLGVRLVEITSGGGNVAPVQLHGGGGEEPVQRRRGERELGGQLVGELSLLTRFDLGQPQLQLVETFLRWITQAVQRLAQGLLRRLRLAHAPLSLADKEGEARVERIQLGRRL